MKPFLCCAVTALSVLGPAGAAGENLYDTVHFDELNLFEVGTVMMVAEDIHENDGGYQQALASGRNWVCIEKLLYEMDGLIERMPAIAQMAAEEQGAQEGEDPALAIEGDSLDEEEASNPYQQVFPTWEQMLEHDGLSWKEWHRIALIKLQDQEGSQDDSELQRVMEEMEDVLTPYLDPNSQAYESLDPVIRDQN